MEVAADIFVSRDDVMPLWRWQSTAMSGLSVSACPFTRKSSVSIFAASAVVIKCVCVGGGGVSVCVWSVCVYGGGGGGLVATLFDRFPLHGGFILTEQSC